MGGTSKGALEGWKKRRENDAKRRDFASFIVTPGFRKMTITPAITYKCDFCPHEETVVERNFSKGDWYEVTRISGNTSVPRSPGQHVCHLCYAVLKTRNS